MSQHLRFASNEAGAAQVTAHLRACDTFFVPPLSGRVNLDEYAHKLVEHGQRFEAWHDTTLVGLVAVYCNTPDKRAAFVTSVSVLPEQQGQGIAEKLLRACLAHVNALGYARLELDVDAGNHAALSLYKKLGFVRDETTYHPMRMIRELGKGEK